MPFNISDFQAQTAFRGFLKPNKFRVTFNLPPAFSRTEPNFNRYNDIVRQLDMWTDAASIPSIQMQTAQLRRYGYGAMDKRPIVPVFGDMQIRVIADGAGMTWELFRRWSMKVNNFDTQGGMYRDANQATSEQANGVRMQAYESSYPTDYTTQVVLSVYNEVGAEQKRIVLTECFPSAVSDIRLDWGDNNNLARFTVNLSMQDWYTVFT